MDNWYKEYRAAILIVSVSFLGVIFIVISCFIDSSIKSAEIWKSVLTGIGGTLATGGIASIFLNLPETKKYLAKTIALLFASGEIVNLLSYEQRRLLDKNILSKDLNIPTNKLDSDLLKRIQVVQKNCHKDFHLENYNIDFTINDSKKFKGYIEEEQLISYRVISEHLPLDHKKDFEIISEYVSPLYNDHGLKTDDFIQDFQCKVGGIVYKKEKVETTEFMNDGVRHLKYKFKTIACVDKNLDVEIKVKVVKPLLDRSYSLYVRFPTKGYSAKLSYNSSCCYSCNWFRYWDKQKDFLESVTDGKSFLNGISVITRDWILPGEGLVLEFNEEKI